MSDLISREVVLKELDKMKKCAKSLIELMFFDAMMAMIDNQPTAYDVDKVVEQLEQSDLIIDQEKCITVEDAIDIVKRGGKDD